MNYMIKDLPVSERPREKLKKYGVQNLTDEDLIAIILRTGTKNSSVKDLAIEIIKNNKSLSNASLRELMKINGMGEVKAVTLLAAIELGKRSTYISDSNKIVFNRADIIFEFFRNKVIHLEQENLIVVFLDNKNRLIDYKTIFVGTINMSITHPREIFKEAMKNSAVYIILIHNHPSGECNPSIADRTFTYQIYKTSKIIGIPLLDHLIIGKNKYYSFYDNGDLNEKYMEK